MWNLTAVTRETSITKNGASCPVAESTLVSAHTTSASAKSLTVIYHQLAFPRGCFITVVSDGWSIAWHAWNSAGGGRSSSTLDVGLPCECIRWTHTHTHTHAHTHTNKQTNAHARTQARARVSIHTHVCRYTHVRRYTHVQAHQQEHEHEYEHELEHARTRIRVRA